MVWLVRYFIRKSFLGAFLIGSSLFLLLGCAVSPITKEREFVLVSEKEEIEIGRKMDPKIIEEYGLHEDRKLQEYVNQVGQKVAQVSHRSDLIYRFKILDSPVVNAFALPGGYIYITRGMLAWLNSEAELACVLAHEIGHVTARHAVYQLTKVRSYQILSTLGAIFIEEYRVAQRRYSDLFDLLFVGILQGYGRKNELQADSLAIEYAFKAGYDPEASVSFMQTLERMKDEPKKERSFFEGLFASHPPIEERIDKNREKAKAYLVDKREVIRLANEYKGKIEDLLYGDDPRHGTVIGNVFRHRDLAIEVTFPKGWKITNEKGRLLVKNPKADHIMELTSHDLAKRITAEVYARDFFRKKGLRLISGTSVRINGLDAFVSVADGRVELVGPVRLKMAFILKGDKAHHLMGLAPPYEFKGVEEVFSQSIFSFRVLSADEAGAIRGLRIKTYKVQRGDTLTSIAEKELGEAEKAPEIAKLNGIEVGTPLKEGDLIKLIK
ncbi:MAG: M48 family metalloprotease [Thermodesulfovibrionales bacterium]|nr:M48 family metalloprotease [Thermodesulfovibrionales bacterium]